MALRLSVLLASVVLMLAGCAGSDDDPRTAPASMSIDLQRYQGTWYELARLPVFSQRQCLQAQAHYTVREAGGIDMINRCLQRDGQWHEVRGIAVPQHAGRTNKLWVSLDSGLGALFPDLAKAKYWVLYHDEDYQVALVGHPDRKSLWLLSRTPQVSEQDRDDLLEIAREQGYDIGRLVWRQQF